MARDQRQWSVYLLKCANGALYCGITSNMEKRLRQHNGILAGGARYTRAHRPVELLGQLICEDKSAALRFEAAVKAMRIKEKLRVFQAVDHAGI